MQNSKYEFIRYAAWSAGLLCAAYAVLWALGVFSGLGFHGTIAAVLGVALTSILAVVLMGLVFFSQNSGHDADVDQASSRRSRDRF